jgi:purine-binding chemotaxis protein CheW
MRLEAHTRTGPEPMGRIERREEMKVVTFLVDGRTFATNLGAVREIRSWQPTTPLPDAADHALGVLNLRGAIIVVYDLRRRLGIAGERPEGTGVIIVVDVGDLCCGLLADSVSDILDVKEDELRDAPEISGDRNDLIEALVVKNDSVITVLRLSAIPTE